MCADVSCDADEEILPTAVEMCLPWRRNTGREPVSSVETHMVPDGSNPVRADGGSWMKGLTHSLSDSQSPSDCDQLSVNVDEDQTTPLCSPNYGLSGDHSTPVDEVKAKDVIGQRRKTSRHSEAPIQPLGQQFGTRFAGRCRPTRCGSFPSSMDAACRAAEHGTEMVAATSRLPWRYIGDEHAIPDQQAPRPVLATHAALISPPPSFVDAVSMYPQVSCQSFRLSEAESRHSEPVHVQHVIDVLPAGHRITPSADSDDEDDDILGNLEQLDSYERICLWLDTQSEIPDDDVPCDDVS